MEINQINSHRANYATERAINNNKINENNGVIMESTNKRKRNEPDNYQSKRRCEMTLSNDSTSSSTNNSTTKEISKEKKLFDNFENLYPHRLISLIYQLELSVLCLHRKYALQNSPEMSQFRNSIAGQFNNILLSFKGDNFCIKVQYIDTYYLKKCLNFDSFFSKKKSGNFTLEIYLNEFAMELINHMKRISDAPKYLIIYTNASLDLSKNKTFRKSNGGENFNSPELITVNTETHNDLFDLFISNGKFYKFSTNLITNYNLKEMVKFTQAVKKEIRNKGFSINEVREAFFERLILAVNQPKIEELIETVRNEVRNRNEDFLKLRNEVMLQLKIDEVTENKSQHLQSILYSFNLFMFCIHNTFIGDKIFTLKFEEHQSTHTITINNFLSLNAIQLDVNKLSPEEFIKQKDVFSIESHFALFLQELDQRDLDYFVIYTNISLSLLEELILGNLRPVKEEADWIYRPRFTNVNTEKEKFTPLRHSFINGKYLHRLSRGEPRGKIIDLLKIPPTFENRRKINEMELKELFMDKIIFAVNQHNTDELYNLLENDIENNLQVPYDCDELYEIALGCLKNRESAKLTKILLKQLFRTRRINESAKEEFFVEFQEEFNFARTVFLQPDVEEFGHFMDFLIKGKGKECLDNLRMRGINISSTIFLAFDDELESNVEKIFLDFYNLLFDEKGNNTRLLNVFEKHGFCLNDIVKMLIASGSKGPAVILLNLYEFWFTKSGNATKYLRFLTNENLSPAEISNLFSKIGAKCVKKITEFYNFWFYQNENRTHYLKILEKSGITLKMYCGILHNTIERNRQLHYCWFDKGERTFEWKRIEDAGVTLSQVCQIMRRSGIEAVNVFRILYKTWFYCGEKNSHLKKLEKEKVELGMIFDILVETGRKVGVIFENLYKQWFQTTGEKTKYLQILEAKGIYLPEICRILSGEGCNAVEKFQEICRNLTPVHSMTLANCGEIKSEVTLARDGVEIWKDEEIFDCEEEKSEIGGNLGKNGDENSRGRQNSACGEGKSEFRGNSGRNGAEMAREGKIVAEEGKFEFSGNLGKIRVEKSKEGKIPAVEEVKSEFSGNLQRNGAEMVKEGKIVAEEGKFEFSGNLGKIRVEKSKEGKIPAVEEVKSEFSGNLRRNGAEMVKEGKIVAKEGKFEFSGNLGKTGVEKSKEGKIPAVEEVKSEFSGNLRRNGAEMVKEGKIVAEEGKFEFSGNLGKIGVEKSKEGKIPAGEEGKFEFSGNLRRNGAENSKEKIVWSISRNKSSNCTEIGEIKTEDEKISQNNYSPGEKIPIRSLMSSHTKEVNFAKIVFPHYKNSIMDFKKFLKFLILGEGKCYLQFLEKNNISWQHVANIFKNSANDFNIIETFKKLLTSWFHSSGESKKCLKNLSRAEVELSDVIFILYGSGIYALEAFENLHRLWFDAKGSKTRYLTLFEANEITTVEISRVFNGSGAKAAESIREFYDLCFDSFEGKTKYLTIMEAEGINLRLIFRILKNTGTKAGEIFQELFHLWFIVDSKNRKKKTERLLNFERNGISLLFIVNRFLLEKGKEGVGEIFENLYTFIFNRTNNKEQYLINLEKEINLEAIFEITNGLDYFGFRKLYDLWFDLKGSKTLHLRLLEESGVNLKCLSCILKGTGTNASGIFKNLVNYFFGEMGEKTRYMKNIEKIMELRVVLKMICGASERICEAFVDLYETLFDIQGRKTKWLLIIEKNRVTLTEVSRLLNGSGLNAAENFKKLSSLVAAKNHLPKEEIFEKFKKRYFNASVTSDN